MLLDCDGPRVTETLESKTADGGGGALLYYPLGFCDHQMREHIWKSLPGIQHDRGSMNAGHCCHETGPQLILPYLLALTKTRNSIGQIRYGTSWWLS